MATEEAVDKLFTDIIRLYIKHQNISVSEAQYILLNKLNDSVEAIRQEAK